LNALNLYSNIEQYLDFSEEVEELYGAYKEIIKEMNPSSLIDIGCGQGDFLLQIQNKSIKTFGVDLSSEQIKVCQEKNINSACIDIADVKETYSCATAIFDVLNYMDENTLKSFLKDTYDVIKTKGYFIFDINTLFGFEEVAQGTLNINLEDKFIALDAYFEQNKLTTNITLFEKTKDNLYTKNENHITQHYHSKDSLIELLASVGFNTQKVVHFNLHEDEESDKFIFICTK